jgi:TrmH family RNA methyltransferase
MGAVFAVPLVRAPTLADLPGTTIALVAGAGAPLAELWRFTSEGSTANAKVQASEAGARLAATRPAEPWRSGSEGLNQNAKVGQGGGVTLLIGAEREGLPEELVAAADHVAQIPIHSHSLNAAMAATVALYEVTRMAPE